MYLRAIATFGVLMPLLSIVFKLHVSSLIISPFFYKYPLPVISPFPSSSYLCPSFLLRLILTEFMFSLLFATYPFFVVLSSILISSSPYFFFISPSYSSHCSSPSFFVSSIITSSSDSSIHFSFYFHSFYNVFVVCVQSTSSFGYDHCQ